MANHLTGLRMPAAFAPTIRASDGVISGRKDTPRPPLSVNSKSCDFISSPLFSVKSSRDSRTGGSNSRKPKDSAAARHLENTKFLLAHSSG